MSVGRYPAQRLAALIQARVRRGATVTARTLLHGRGWAVVFVRANPAEFESSHGEQDS
jgi:hypothetical protein